MLPFRNLPMECIMFGSELSHDRRQGNMIGLGLVY